MNTLYQQLPIAWQNHFLSQPKKLNKEFNEKVKESLNSIAENLTIWQQNNPKRDIFPKQAYWFKALELTKPENVNVVILGQDPYHGSEQAHGLAFSVLKNQKIPPSLQNVFKELIDEKEINTCPPHGNLSQWAKQGVLLLNHTLTVGNNEANSHAKIGWGIFTDLIIESLQLNPFIIYCLWGNFAQKKETLISNPQHIILKSGHPSPLSVRYFKGCGHFTKINQLLQTQKTLPIDWSLSE